MPPALKATGRAVDSGISVRRLPAIPLPYVAALVLAGVIGGGIYVLRQSGAATKTSAAVAASVAHSHTIARPNLNTTVGLRANSEASKSATQILADAASTLRIAKGFELTGAESQNGQTWQVRIVASGHSVDMAAATTAGAYEILSVSTGVYIRANASFWTQHLGARGAILADRWIRSPSAALASDGAHFAPARLARCLTEDHGTLTIEGTTSINGQPAVVLRDAGNLPGTQPGTLAVATTGRPYPLRMATTGRQRAGGRIDVCNEGHASGSPDGTFAFSHFDQIPPLQPPTNAIETTGSPVA